ncbi:hypothetical protein OROGR_027794 [Orobanche gracilis]
MGILERGVRVLRCAAKSCPQSRWCSSQSASAPALPLLMLPPSREGGKGSVTAYNLYSPALEKVISIKKRGEEHDRSGVDESRVVGSSHGWVALFNEKREDGDLFLWDPLSGRQIKLPPMKALPDAYPKHNYGRAGVTKVIISCSPDKKEECRAMMIYGGGERLAFCRPFVSNSKWTRIGDLRYEEDGEIWGRSYQEFVYSASRELFFCVTKNGELEAWDPSPKLQWRVHLPKEEGEEEEFSGVELLNYLVFDEQSAQLLLVKRHVLERMGPDGTYVKHPLECDGTYDDPDLDPFDECDRYPHKTIAFDVDRLDNNGGASVIRLTRPRPTAGITIFLGINQSFAISAPHDQLKPNSIYFTDPHPGVCMRETSVYGGHDIGVFNYENRTFSACYYPCDVSSLKIIMPPPFWFTPTHS